MPIPETGPVSMQDISTEFPGNANPLSISEYYAGGLYVPAGTTGNLGLIPATGLITLDHFRGSELIVGDLHVLSPVEVAVPSNSGFSASADGTIIFGNFVPQLLQGATPVLMRLFTHNDVNENFFVALVGQGHPQTFWTKISVGGQEFESALADDYDPAGGANDTVWTFENRPTRPWTNGVDTDVNITYP